VIWLDNAGGDFRKRGFPGAIRAQKRNDFAPTKKKINILKRANSEDRPDVMQLLLRTRSCPSSDPIKPRGLDNHRSYPPCCSARA
jgi:hypothetical protein